ncbi:flavodoxin and radical SAM domain protein [Myxozyma melibiosi]|uniref:tRNA 4-demethylwyosine synthase (AdoMet-dependent) n=1 Tax=Myxozyma melibiosi TaxID=54550 RepID=A0ABR1FEZ2_9ASCO
MGEGALSTWHEIRFPLILGATFCYVYWRYCFYQPRATIPKKGGRSARESGRPPSDDEDDEDDDSEDYDSTTEKTGKESADAKSKNLGSPSDDAATSTEETGTPVSSAPTKQKKARQVKVFTRRAMKAGDTRLLNAKSDIHIFYSTLTSTTEKYASQLHSLLKSHPVLSTRNITIQNIDYLDDLDSHFVTPARSLDESFYLFVLPSYESESPLDYFIETLKDTYNDFRIDSRPLRRLGGYAVFGLGDMNGWDHMFCYQALLVDKYLGKLGAPRAFPVGTGNVKGDIEKEFKEWSDHLFDTLADPTSVAEIPDITMSDDESEEANDEEEFDIVDPASVKISRTTKANDVVDVEDMGAIIQSSKVTSTKKEMVGKDSPTYASLTKQGYTIVGSHSGVKICRWTKSALRGRGSCYKFAFYGIKSHLCMETTPSLSCSNKCVFCWRHGTNPVGTTWRWQVDPPEAILKGALEGHYKKIKQMRGVPGVQAARFAEAFTVRHCALSLVGEPIFYPHINEFVGMLHERHISSFLVCNAQHPDQLARMNQVTQLYVSIDAADKESLRRVDKPLHRDFWERFNKCLDILKTKKNQRTVFRLTLVKGFNAEEVLGYARLVAQALPCFVEVKGVTYCGNSAPSGPGASFSKGASKDTLTMANVPFYEEVLDFVKRLNEALADQGLEYDIAAEHAHSCCILIAQKRFKIDGDWYTHIAYDRFFELLESGVEFGPMDYIAKTPEWAQFGSEQAGFNPEDERVKHKSVVKREMKLKGSRSSSEASLPVMIEVS